MSADHDAARYGGRLFLDERGPAQRRYLRTTVSRETHRPVTTGHADDLGLDDCGGDCRWYNVCNDHGNAVGHRTQMLARSFAAVPTEWCEDCRIEWTVSH